MQRAIKVAAFVLIGLVVALFFFAFILALGNAEGAASFMGYFRDLLMIVLSLQGILIFAGLAIFFVQLARFFNLLNHEMKPLAEEAKSALATVKQTTQFVTKHGVEPFIQTQSFLAGLVAFLRELFRWRKLFRKKETP
ncbi:MAG: hypothetical protein RML73_14670 [Anaerolineae bacterium]|nr:hypothetical protein [Anaerolineae bacterium]